MSLTSSGANLMHVKTKAVFFMSIDSRNIRKIGICFVLLAFVFVTIILPADAPDAVTTAAFTLILILEILFALSLSPQQRLCLAYRCGIFPRGPPNR